MVITRSPLRITFGGGGTDLPSYYRKYGGFLISGAINKYLYVTVSRPFIEGIFLKYNKFENVMNVNDIQHPIIREAIRMLDFKTPQIEITTLADIPAGTGLGSSGSFTTALLKALFAYRRRLLPPEELARLACEIELDRLHEPIGKQDQYISAYGGITCFEFNQDDTVVAYPLSIKMETLYDLEDNMLLFFTGFARSASEILKDQDSRSKSNDGDMLLNLHHTKELGLRSKSALEKGKVDEFGELLDVHWQHKRKRSNGMSNPQIDEWYDLAMRNGALGGKLVGAGGGGFLLFYAKDRNQLRKAMSGVGLEEVRFQYDFDGTKVLIG